MFNLFNQIKHTIMNKFKPKPNEMDAVNLKLDIIWIRLDCLEQALGAISTKTTFEGVSYNGFDTDGEGKTKKSTRKRGNRKKL